MIFNRPTGFFVTGTDTNVGKTVVAAWLVRCLAACYWKPIQCGVDEQGHTDSQTVAHLADLPPERIMPEHYILTDPVSPHEAARRDHVSIAWQQLVTPLNHQGDHKAGHQERLMIVEGAGGALVPVTSSHTMIDVMAVLGLPIVVVARPILGTINHSLLTLEALRMRKLTIAGVVFSGVPEPHVRDAVLNFGQTSLIAELPFVSSCTPETIDHMASNIQPRLDQGVARLDRGDMSNLSEHA